MALLLINIQIVPAFDNMDVIISSLQKRFPYFAKNDVIKIYKARCERLRLLMIMKIPLDLRWLIEAKVRTDGEFSKSFIPRLAGLGKSTYSKKRRARRMGVCSKCARWTCNTRCRTIGMASINRYDKIDFIKDGLSKESLDDIHLTLETHSSGMVQRHIIDLWEQFRKEHVLSLGNLTLKDPVCQFLRKLDGKRILDS